MTDKILLSNENFNINSFKSSVLELKSLFEQNPHRKNAFLYVDSVLRFLTISDISAYNEFYEEAENICRMYIDDKDISVLYARLLREHSNLSPALIVSKIEHLIDFQPNNIELMTHYGFALSDLYAAKLDTEHNEKTFCIFKKIKKIFDEVLKSASRVDIISSCVTEYAKCLLYYIKTAPESESLKAFSELETLFMTSDNAGAGGYYKRAVNFMKKPPHKISFEEIYNE